MCLPFETVGIPARADVHRDLGLCEWRSSAFKIELLEAAACALPALTPDGTSRERHDTPVSVPQTEIARALVATLGGRYSRELGIDLDAGGAGVDQWFCAVTLFGTRISTTIAVRAYRALADAGVRTVSDAGERPWDDLVAVLDAGGYVRYDFRTATRLQQLATEVRVRCRGTVASLATLTEPHSLEATLDAFPGWGPTTVRIFLRELRDVWPGAQPPLDERALRAARHLKFAVPRRRSDQVGGLRGIAGPARLDVRDLETALVRLTLVHRDMTACAGGARCRKLVSVP